MQYGICNLSIVSLRYESNNKSEMVSQVLFGEVFKVLEKRTHWSKIRLTFDDYEGWIDNNQYITIPEDEYINISTLPFHLSGELIDYISDDKQNLTPIPLGASIPLFKNGSFKIKEISYTYEGRIFNEKRDKNDLIKTAFMYLNSPFLWGGKTPFGIDCSGFSQMVYKLCGYKLLRDASQQATQGEVLSFIEESEPGDLAFFDDKDGEIIHVGIIMKDNYIIHAHGKVRIDRLDHSGIYNVDSKNHTHKLRVIKKII